MSLASSTRWLLLAIGLLLWNSAAPSSANQGSRVKLQEPLPLEVAVSLRGHNGRSSLRLSPDGRWLVHTVRTEDTMESNGGRYSLTGMPFAEGNARMEATLSDMDEGSTSVLGSTEGSSWAPTFSPDGSKVAFYSDEDGEAALWIFDMKSREKKRVADLVVRPFFGFEVPAWDAKGSRILVKALSEGKTVAEANEGSGRSFGRSPSQFPDVEEGEASVIVRRVEAPTDLEKPPEEPKSESMETEEKDPRHQEPPVGDMSNRVVDLALVDVASGSVQRVVTDEAVGLYAFSPDGSKIAYSVIKGAEPATQQPNYDLRVHDLDSSSTRVLGENLRLGYGIEWSWSPDSRWIAYIPSGQMARRVVEAGGSERIVLHEVDGEQSFAIGELTTPNFDPGDGELPPYWSADGGTLYALADGDLWKADFDSRKVSKLASLDGWRIRTLVLAGRTQAWSPPGAEELWVVARGLDAQNSSIWKIDAASGAMEKVHEEPKSYYGIFNASGAPAAADLVWVATGLREPADLWTLDTSASKVRKASSLNPDLDQYELGSARLINWRSLYGEELRGALLLPPGFEVGSSDPLPLVVWVYAGSMGSRSINTFGFWGGSAAFNMHVLATRGYAVLFPDAPVRPGTPVRDLMATVLPGVNAAIDGGFADPERLALMGQSYGSYNTLALITETDRFKAAIITAAVLHPDLFADYLRSMGYYEQGQGNMGGTIWEVPDRFRENSPIFRFDQIKTPLLIGQGENDGDLEPAEAIFAALERLKKPVEYRLYEDEGHVLTKDVNVIDFWNRRLEFLAEHLDLDVVGGRAVAPKSAPKSDP